MRLKIGMAICALAALGLGICTVSEWRKVQSFDYLQEYGGLGDWSFCGHELDQDTFIPRWFPGVWPRHLSINTPPEDTARYAAAVRSLPRLDSIMVFVYRPMSVDVFTALGAVPAVKVMDLSSSSVTDEAFEKFQQFATVEKLLLDNSGISDASMRHLIRFTAVRTLNIYNVQLTDAAVIQVASLPALQEVAVDGKLSAETIAALRLKIATVTVNDAIMDRDPAAFLSPPRASSSDLPPKPCN
jgi:hypothetical protein